MPTSCDGGCIPTVRATVDGRDAVLLVDTGSPVTVLFSKTDAAVHAARRGIAHVLAQPHFIDDGDTYRVSTIGVIDDVGVRAGGRAMRSKSLVVIPRPDGLEEVDGLLGLDVLQQCAIVVDSGARGALACEGAPNEMEGVPAIAKAPRVKPLLVRGTVASIGDDLVTIDKVEVRGTSHAAEIESALARDDLTCDSPLEDKLDLGDQSALAELYDQGLLDAKVRHSVERHGRHVVVRFDVTDGRVYRYSGITVAGDLVAPEADYLALLRQKNGDVVNRSAIVDALDAIRAFHRKRHRPNLSVEPEVTLAPAAGTLRLVIRVTRPAR